MKRVTSFGTMETLKELNGTILSEYLCFEREGRAHSHEAWEICYVTKGSGIIYCGKEIFKVEAGSVCKIPPNTPHWMKPEPKMEILLVYHTPPT